MKKQVVVIHGGNTFNSYEEYFEYLKSYDLSPENINRFDWKNNLFKILPDYEVFYPTMPDGKYAKYPERKLWFEKMIPLLNDGVILVGHSLGGIFLAKYLSENNFPKKISAVHMVAAPFDAEGSPWTLGEFNLPKSLAGLAEQAGKLFFYQSQDDHIVSVQNLEKYQEQLPNAEVRVFQDKGHFLQEEFPELVENIRKFS